MLDALEAVGLTAGTLEQTCAALGAAERPFTRPSKCPAEFRKQAVELVKASGKTGAEVARDLSINDTTLGGPGRARGPARAPASSPEAARATAFVDGERSLRALGKVLAGRPAPPRCDGCARTHDPGGWVTARRTADRSSTCTPYGGVETSRNGILEIASSLGHPVLMQIRSSLARSS